MKVAVAVSQAHSRSRRRRVSSLRMSSKTVLALQSREIDLVLRQPQEGMVTDKQLNGTDRLLCSSLCFVGSLYILIVILYVHYLTQSSTMKDSYYGSLNLRAANK